MSYHNPFITARVVYLYILQSTANIWVFVTAEFFGNTTKTSINVPRNVIRALEEVEGCQVLGFLLASLGTNTPEVEQLAPEKMMIGR